jgi:hypothetical protein
VIVMTKLIETLAVSAAVALAPVLAAAQQSEWEDTPAPQAAQPEQAPPPPPAEAPPAPQAQPPAPQAQAPAPAPVPPGQWVYTQQYGWIWMPYADAYTSVPAGGSGTPYAFVYYPAFAVWTWVAAPWIWGVGPWPVFGVYGAVHFGWYGHGWWRYPSYWHYYGPAYAGGFRPGYRPVPPYRPAPYRGGFNGYRGPVASAPGYRAPAFVAHGAVRAPAFTGHGGGFSSGRSWGGGGRGGGGWHGGGGHGHGR